VGGIYTRRVYTHHATRVVYTRLYTHHATRVVYPRVYNSGVCLPYPGITVVYASHTRVYTGVYTFHTQGIYRGVHFSHPGYTSVLGRMRHNEARLNVRLWENGHNEARLIVRLCWENEAQRGASYRHSLGE